MIMGLDTRSRAFHWVSDERPFYGRSAAEERSTDTQDEVRARLFWDAKALFETLPRGAWVFCEEPLALKNGKTTRLLSLAAGSIFAAFVAAKPDAFWYWVDPATWKKEILGAGQPPKGVRHKPWIQEVLLRAVEFSGWADEADAFDTFDRQPDYYDAWCLMRYGVKLRQEGRL